MIPGSQYIPSLTYGDKVALGVAIMHMSHEQAEEWAGLFEPQFGMGNAFNDVDPIHGSIPRGLRRKIYERDAYLCQYCGVLTYQNPNSEHVAISRTVDHVIPRAANGTNEPENLVTACRRCNYVAGSRVFDNFSAKRTWILDRLAEAKIT